MAVLDEPVQKLDRVCFSDGPTPRIRVYVKFGETGEAANPR
jgi:hypothetical protein